MSSTQDALLERERQFHNERFAGETRVAQEKYYWAIRDCDRDLREMVHAAAAGGRVLEYGCATGGHAIELARRAARVDGIDISDVAIGQARERAAALGLCNASFAVGDAHATGYDENTFDLVFGSGIIHHLDTERSLREIHRILKPGGVAVFKEPLGSNIAINLYRSLTPSARTEDEHPLRPVDKRLADQVFDSVTWRFYGLATLATVPLQASRLGPPAYRAAAGIDRILAAIPGMRWQLWYALLTLRK